MSVRAIWLFRKMVENIFSDSRRACSDAFRWLMSRLIPTTPEGEPSRPNVGVMITSVQTVDPSFLVNSSSRGGCSGMSPPLSIASFALR